MKSIASFQPKTSFCWIKIEKFVGEKFPECVKILLQVTGYDRLNSLKKLDAERISEIEAHLDTNREWVNELKCCNSQHYKQLAVFKFLPGHKATILDIPQQIQRMQQVEEDQPIRGDAVGVKKVVARNASHTQQSDDIIQKLVANLVNYAKNINFPLEDGMISSKNVNDFEPGSASDKFAYQCRFSCPFCSKVFPVKYGTFWQSSNVTKHFRDHLSLEIVEVELE